MQRIGEARRKMGNISLMALCFSVLFSTAPVSVSAQTRQADEGYSVVKTPKVCAFSDGRLKPIYGCAKSHASADSSTMPELAQTILDRQTPHLCHARVKGSAGYNATVGWGTYIDTPEEMEFGKCPPAGQMGKWFMRDVAESYARGQDLARVLHTDNACLVRTLASIDYQLGDLRRKFPESWALIARGQVCQVAANMLSWSWYQQSCDRALDNILALDALRGGCKVQVN